MDSKDAEALVKSLRNDDGTWRDFRHVATTTFRKGVLAKLSPDPALREDGRIACAEIWLTDELPRIQSFDGIFAVDDRGLWFYDGDGDIDGAIWRQGLIPWSYVKTMLLHQSS